MTPHPAATVGIAGHYDRAARRGGWAVYIRFQGEEIALYGRLDRTGLANCELFAVQRAIRALARMRVPLEGIEVSYSVKQQLTAERSPRPGDAWAPGRAWWRAQSTHAGLRVKRMTADAYGAAAAQAEIAALTGLQKRNLTQAELNTPGNRELKATRADNRLERRQRKQEREERGLIGRRANRREPASTEEYLWEEKRRIRALHPPSTPVSNRAPAAPSGPIPNSGCEELDRLLLELGARAASSSQP